MLPVPCRSVLPLCAFSSQGALPSREAFATARAPSAARTRARWHDPPAAARFPGLAIARVKKMGCNGDATCHLGRCEMQGSQAGAEARRRAQTTANGARADGEYAERAGRRRTRPPGQAAVASRAWRAIERALAGTALTWQSSRRCWGPPASASEREAAHGEASERRTLFIASAIVCVSNSSWPLSGGGSQTTLIPRAWTVGEREAQSRNRVSAWPDLGREDGETARAPRDAPRSRARPPRPRNPRCRRRG